MNETIWTATDFETIMNRLPEKDDLERANCPDAGKSGHWQCGICEHNKPVFMCSTCMEKGFSNIKRI
jgi:hypothetical protein